MDRPSVRTPLTAPPPAPDPGSAPRTHVVGAGLAGLAAAVSLALAGRAVTLHEAGGRAGGRCRSYPDARLGRLIDNGNHLLLSGNRAAMRYLADIGAADALVGPVSACFPFLDVRTGRRWTLRPSRGRLPWWLLRSGRRVPDTKARDYLSSALRLAAAGPERTVADCVGDRGALFERFWEPLAVAALNTPAGSGASRLLWPVLRETFARGEAACRPRIARVGLSHAFVDPALRLLRRRGAAVRFGRRLRGIAWAGGPSQTPPTNPSAALSAALSAAPSAASAARRAATHLDFGSERVALQEGESVILAVPPAAASALVPSLTAPRESSAIVNVHFRLSEPARLPGEAPFLGLIGGTAQWLFVRGDVASITVSAAGALAAEPAEAIAGKAWEDAAAALGLGRGVPPYRVVKERRATFAQTPGEARRRPKTRCGLANVYLAGDWTDTGLPATIEGAIRSGYMAARAVTGG